MRNMNEVVILTALVGATAEVIVKEDFKQDLISFDVAVSQGSYKDDEGNWQDRQPKWYACELWVKKGEGNNIAKNITKGREIKLSGSPKANAYINKDGEAVGQLSLRVDNFELGRLPKPKEEMQE